MKATPKEGWFSERITFNFKENNMHGGVLSSRLDPRCGQLQLQAFKAVA